METIEDKKAWSQVIERWGKEYDITKVTGTEVVLSNLKSNQAVCYGDGKTYHFVLTKLQDHITTKDLQAIDQAREENNV